MGTPIHSTCGKPLEQEPRYPACGGRRFDADQFSRIEPASKTALVYLNDKLQ